MKLSHAPTFHRLSQIIVALIVLCHSEAYAQSRKPSSAGGKNKPKPAPAESQQRRKTDDSGTDSSAAQNARMGESASKKKPTADPKRKQAFLGISGDLGYEATYGNGATLHLYPVSMIDLNAGAGYNSTGFKAGAGPAFLLWFTPSAGALLGASYVYSQGTSGSISLDANFTPEGSSTTEKIKATKKYKVSSASILGTYAGMTFHLSDAIRIDLKGCYNKVISGNTVTFDDKAQFDKTISPTNEDAFNKKFDDQASELVQAGGLGFSIGLQFLL